MSTRKLYDRIIGILLIPIFFATLLGLPADLRPQAASWMAYLALMIAPGYWLGDIVLDKMDVDWIERAGLAFPLGITILTPTGLIVMLAHLTYHTLIFGWALSAGLVLVVWLVWQFFTWYRPEKKASRWAIDEILFIVLIFAGFLYAYATISTTTIDGDTYTFMAYVRDGYQGLPINQTEPIFGTELGPGVRSEFNQVLPQWILWARLSHLDPIPLTESATRPMLALWSILAAYVLGKAGGNGSRRFGLFTVAIQALIFLANPFLRDDSVSTFFFKFTYADKYFVSVIMLPVIFGLAIRYIRKGETRIWIAAALATLAVSTIHAFVAAMLALGLAAFGGVHLLVNFKNRDSWKRVGGLAALTVIVMILPLIQLVIANTEFPLAPTYPDSFNGWAIGEQSTPFLPTIDVSSLNTYGPLPDLSKVQAQDANLSSSPFLIWRFSVNMRRARLVIFGLNDYISHPSLILEPPYLLVLLFFPLFLWKLRSNLAAQFTIGSMLAVIFALYNPIVTPILGKLVTPWIVWRFVWMIPYALGIALAIDLLIPPLTRLALRLIERAGEIPLEKGRAYILLPVFTVMALLMTPMIIQNIRTMGYDMAEQLSQQQVFPAPQTILLKLRKETAQGPAMVAASQGVSVVIPAFAANANIIGHRIFNTSEIFPATEQVQALQRLIDQNYLFETPVLTPESVRILQDYDIRYMVVESGSDLDLQLRLAPQWFIWMLDDQGYSLYKLRRAPVTTKSIQGNEALFNRDWVTAKSDFQAALKQNPSDLLALEGMVQSYRLEGKFTQATRLLEQLVKQYPLPQLHYQLSQYYAESDRRQESLAELQIAAQESPLVPRYQTALANACLQRGNLACASQENSLAAENIQPQDFAAQMVLLGNMWNQQGQIDQAVAAYEKAVHLRPSQDNQLLLASAYQDAQQYDQAGRVLLELRKEDPLSADYLARMASVEDQRGNQDAAIGLYQRAIHLQDLLARDPTPAKTDLATLYTNYNLLDAAQSEIHQMIQDQPHSATAYLLLGNLYSQENQPEQSIQAYEHALVLNPARISSYVRLNSTYNQQAEEDRDQKMLEGIAGADTYTDLNTKKAPLFLSMGDQLLKRGDQQGAIVAYLFVLDLQNSNSLYSTQPQQSLDSTRALAYIRLAQLYESKADWDRALSFYQAAVDTNPSQYWNKILLADALNRHGDFSQADEIYRSIIQSDPTFINAYLKLRDSLSAQGQTEGLDQLLQQALQNLPAKASQPQGYAMMISPYSSPDLAYLFSSLVGSSGETGSGTSQVIKKNSDELTKIFIQAMESDQELAQVQTLANLYQETGQGDKAVALYQEKIKNADRDKTPPVLLSQYLSGLGNLYIQQGQTGLAIQAFQKSIQLNQWSPESYIYLGNAYSKNGDASAAIQQYQKAVETAPGMTEAQIALGDAYYSGGKTAEAQAIYQQVLETTPGDLGANLSMAKLLEDEGNLSEARNYYLRAIQADQSDPSTYTGLAGVYLDQANFKAAEATLHQAFNVNQTYAPAISKLGDLYALQGKTTEAISQYEKAISAQPDLWQAYAGLASVYSGQGNTGQAINLLEQAGQADEQAYEPLLTLSSLYQGLGQYDQAEEALQQALQRSPGNPDVRYALADLYRATSRPQDALAQLQLATQENPGSMEALTRYANELQRQGQFDEAASAYQQAAQASQPTTAGYRLLANAYQSMGRTQDALDLIGKALQRDPNQAESWVQKGQLEAYQGNQDTALAAFQKAVQIDPESSATWAAFGDWQQARSNWTAAEKSFQQATLWGPNDPEGYLGLGHLYMSRGMPTEAFDQYIKAAGIKPAPEAALIAIGDWYSALNDWNEAGDFYQKAAKAAPADPTPYLDLGQIHMNENMLSDAYRQFNQALAIAPGSSSTYVALGDWNQNMHYDQAAENAYLQAIKISPGDIEGIIHLGQFYQNKSRNKDALAQFQRALEISPASGEAINAIGNWYYAKGNWQQSESYYQQAISADPGYLPAYLSLAHLYTILGQPDNVSVELAKALAAGLAPNVTACAFGKLPGQPLQVGKEASLSFQVSSDAWRCQWEYRPWASWTNLILSQLSLP